MPRELPPADAIRHVHLTAVAGTGMGSLACMLAARGYRVTGSDLAAYPPMSDQLRAAGIEIAKGFAPEHALEPRPDLVIIGNAVKPDNPEARAVIEADLPYASFPDAVAHFFGRDRHCVVISGTHGKTTTTSLVGWILAEVGLDPTVLVGGVVPNFDGSFRLGNGEHFVVEGDEYDSAFFDKTPKFLHYGARSLLFTSCEFDHADIYSSLDEIKVAFTDLVKSMPADGRIIAATDVPAVVSVLASASVPVEGYGFQQEAVWKVSDVVANESCTTFNVWQGDDRLARVESPLHGRHNLENVLGAMALCHSLGVDLERAAEALTRFAGVKRRQEVRGEAAGVTVIDDFAHHPTAVRETLAAMRSRFPGRALWAIFEPRTNTSRRRFFENDYIEALGQADHVIVADVYQSDQIPEEDRMRPDRVVQALCDKGIDAAQLGSVDDMVDRVVRGASGHDVAVVMSNGAFGGIWDLLIDRLRKAEN